MQKIEIPFQDLGINTEVDDDQNPGYTRQERTNFINGKVEKIKGLANQQLSGINMDPDIVKFWKFEDREYFLVVDNNTGQIYKFGKDLSNPELLYTATGGALRVDIEGSKAIIYNLGQSPLVSVVIDRNMYHGIVGGGNYPKFNGSFLDWNRVRVFDDVASPSAGKKLFKIVNSLGSNAQKIKNPGQDYLFDRLGKNTDKIVPFGRPSALSKTPSFMFMYPQRKGNLELAGDGSDAYYYRYSLIFDGQQETELSESILNTSGIDFTSPKWGDDEVDVDNFGFNSIFMGKFQIDIGNPNVAGSFYPGNPRVTGINIYRSKDADGLSEKFKKIISASTLNSKADLNAQSSINCHMGAGNFLYDNCDFSQIGITTDDFVYQAGIGNISEVEPNNSEGNSQKGLLKFSSSTLGGGRGCHPEMTGEPWKDISSNYVIVNRDLDQPLDEHGTYWCAEQDGLKDAGGSNDCWFETTTSGSSAATLRNFVSSSIAGGDDRDSILDIYNLANADMGQTGSLNRQNHDNVAYLHGSGDRFIHSSFNSNAPASLAASTEYYYEIYYRLPTYADNLDESGSFVGNYTHFVAYEGGTAPTSHSITLDSSNSTHLASVGREPEKWTQSGYDSPPTNYVNPATLETNFEDIPKQSRRYAKLNGFYTTASGSPKFTLIAYTSSSPAPYASFNTTNGTRGRISIFEFLITKSEYVKRKGHNGASMGCYSDDFIVADDNTLENYFYTILDGGYPKSSDNNGWIVGNYGKCVLPWSWAEEKTYDFSDPGPTESHHRYSFHRAINSVLLLNSRIPTHEGDGSIIISPNYRYSYNVSESGAADTQTNNVIVDFDFIDDGITDGAEHPGTITLSTDVRYKYQANHIGRRFVGNVIINGDKEDFETHEDFIMYSELGNPDVIPIANFIKLNDLDGGQITGLAKSLGDLVALMERGVFILSIPSTDITQWTLTEAYRDIGCTAPDSVLEYNNGVFFANETNFYYLDSGRRLISLADSWLNTYQQYFREGGISQVIVNPNKNELILIINNFTYVMSLNGFEETARWHKSIQSAVADGDWDEAGIEDLGDQVNVKYVVDNFKQLYKFEERLSDFKRDLVLHSLDDTASDAYTNNTDYGLVIETPFQKLTDLDSNSIVRKFNLRYNSIDDITLEFYVDGDASTIAKTITIPASSTLANYDDNVDFTYEANIKLRANRIKIKISTPESSNTLTSIRRLELEVD